MEVVEDSDPKCTAVIGARPLRRPLWEFCELTVSYALILTVIWTPRPLQHWLYWLAIAWFVFSICISFPGWKAMGCTAAGFWRSAWVVGVALILAAGGMMLASDLHTLHRPSGFVGWVLAFGGYTVWSLANSFFCRDTFWRASSGSFPTQR